jgi:hypothetical protein
MYPKSAGFLKSDRFNINGDLIFVKNRTYKDMFKKRQPVRGIKGMIFPSPVLLLT